MKRKPIVGIIGKAETKYEEDLWNRITLWDEFRYYLVKSGAVAIMLLPSEATLEFNDDDIHDDTVLTEEQLEDIRRQSSFCDGFILQGGLNSSTYEVEFAKMAISEDKPLLGICAGFNNILRALGGEVMVDESGSHNHYDLNYRHEAIIEKDSQLYEIIRKDVIQVNSIHTMIAADKQVSPFAKANAHSRDGLVEGFELPDKKFVLGLKWHPEIMPEEDYTERLFRYFTAKCAE